jgi:centromere protein I
MSDFLEPIEVAVLDGTDESKMILLRLYTSLHHRWTSFLISNPDADVLLNESIPSLALQSLIRRADLLSLSLLASSAHSVPATSCILSFWETVADSFLNTNLFLLFRIVVPSDYLVYQICFSGSLMCLSRMCGILAKYKRAFEQAMNAVSGKSEGSYPRDYVNHFNGFLMDICNFLWRNRAFNKDDLNALGCHMPNTLLPDLRAAAEERDQTLPTLYSLSHSTVFAALSIQAFRRLEDQAVEAGQDISLRHAGPVTQRSLTLLGNEGGLKITWANYRLAVLQHLEDLGVGGVSDLMYNTMKHLMSAREAGGPIGGGPVASAS